MKWTRVFSIAALAAVLLYFAVSAAGGLGAYFSADDGGNLLSLHKCFESSLARCSRAWSTSLIG